MIPVLSVAVRTFLFAFAPMCAVLAVSFSFIHTGIRENIKLGLSDSLTATENALARASVNHDRWSRHLLSAVSENVGLKASIGLLREVPVADAARPQVQRTIVAHLQELRGRLNADLLAVSDAQGSVIAMAADAPGSAAIRIHWSPREGPGASLLEVNGTIYHATSSPITLGEDYLGSLLVGRTLDLRSWCQSGHIALIRDRRVVASTLPGPVQQQLQRELERQCARGYKNCEVKVGAETHLVLELERAHLPDGHNLLSIQSIEAAMKPFTAGLRRVFLGAGAVGILLVLLGSALASRHVAKPFTLLLARLRESQKTGRLEPNFTVHSPTREANLLAEALNRAAEAVQESQSRLDDAYLQFVGSLAQALDARDRYTAGHSNRVSLYAVAIAHQMQLPRDQIEVIRVGALLHDIGKIGIPDDVLQKPDRLTAEEFGLIQLHPQIGRKILQRVGHFQDYLPIVELHHEDYDGGGYPYGLRGDEIPQEARIVRVADAYDAMTSDRAYRKALPRDQVLANLQAGSGAQFDPGVVRALMATLPPGGVGLPGAGATEVEYALV
jgi:putative nucleotidyltransferase with HDIG domain